MICEKCGKEHDGSYGKGRFCSKSCASSRAFSEETREKISLSLRNSDRFKRAMKSRKDVSTNHLVAWRNTEKEKRLNKKVKVVEKIGKKQISVELDITNKELEEYRKSHRVCDMCGMPEFSSTSPSGKPNALSIDHDHKTGCFRGLLCYKCNRHLGWYDNNKEMVDNYLNRWQKGVCTPPQKEL